MRRVRYGVGMSLDGYIADSADAMDWMVGDPAYDAKPFFASIDTVLMGRRSYEVMLRHGARAYPGLRTYVFSRTLLAADPLLPSSARSVGLELTHHEAFPSGLVVLHDAVRRGAA